MGGALSLGGSQTANAQKILLPPFRLAKLKHFLKCDAKMEVGLNIIDRTEFALK